MGQATRKFKVVLGMLLFLLVGAVAFAGSSPAGAVESGTIATEAITNLTGLVTGAMPFIAAAIGLGVVLSWVRRLFRA